MLKRIVAADVRKRIALLPDDPPPHVGGYTGAGAPSIARPEPANDTKPSNARRSAPAHGSESQTWANRGISHTNTCAIGLMPGFTSGMGRAPT